MATAYTARAAEANYPAKTRPESGQIIQQINFSNPSVTVVTGDSVELCKIPSNALITDMLLGLSGIDAHATAPTATVTLGLTKATSGEADVDEDGFMAAVTGRYAATGAVKYTTPADFNGALAFPYLASGDGTPADGIHSKLTFKVTGTLGTAGTAMKIVGWVAYTMDADWESSSDPA